ncbi:phenol hydroxylase subunit [Nevskia sp.]|uniref:phenol hydroxylase subunit n=1 Tax=Nevskia sp. TaxID=1929292 RepID=UPI0025DAB982|nr:phenol hydroxylase subunit [Nevskia sp.]
MTVVSLHPGRNELGAQQRYVRLREQRPDGFVIFDFAIGDPQLSCELIMPLATYQEFCASNHVVHLNETQAAQLDEEALKWRYGQPGVSE